MMCCEPRKRRERFGPKQAVSIGDDADEDGSSQFSGFWF